MRTRTSSRKMKLFRLGFFFLYSSSSLFISAHRRSLRIQWGLIFAIVILCSRLHLNLMKFFKSVIEIKKLRKEINRLLSERKCQIFIIKLLLRKTDLLKLLLWGELQLMQISMNFKALCCSLKIRGLGARLYAAFLLFYFSKELWRFKIK